jgi:site-specific recombinase XerD
MDLPRGQIAPMLAAWIRSCKVRQMSPKTIAERERIIGLLSLFCAYAGHTHMSRLAIEEFITSLGTTERPWENRERTRGRPLVAMRPISVQSHYRVVRAFCNWMVEQDYLSASPMAKMKPPIARPDQIQPLTNQQVHRLVEGARKTEYPLRNVAIIFLILDTGLRASEVCGLQMRDIDMDAWGLRVLGKGNKHRTVYLGSRTAQRALLDYLRIQERQPEEFVIQSERNGGAPLTPHGLLFVVKSCGEAGGVAGVGPHDLRHTFAFNFIAGGGTEFTLQTMLGHTSLAMTRKYVNLAGADLSAQARAVGTLDKVMKKK